MVVEVSNGSGYSLGDIVVGVHVEINGENVNRRLSLSDLAWGCYVVRQHRPHEPALERLYETQPAAFLHGEMLDATLSDAIQAPLQQCGDLDVDGLFGQRVAVQDDPVALAEVAVLHQRRDVGDVVAMEVRPSAGMFGATLIVKLSVEERHDPCVGGWLGDSRLDESRRSLFRRSRRFLLVEVLLT